MIGVRFSVGAHPTSYPVSTGALSMVVKWLGCEADHSPRLRMYLHSLLTSPWRGVLVKYRICIQEVLSRTWYTLMCFGLAYITAD
jgi:hypothetical protein